MPSRRTSLVNADGTSVPVPAPGAAAPASAAVTAEALALASAGAGVAVAAAAAPPPAAAPAVSAAAPPPAIPPQPQPQPHHPPQLPGPGGTIPPPVLTAQQVRARQHRQMALLAQEELARRSAEHQHQQRQRLAAAATAATAATAAGPGGPPVAAVPPGAVAAVPPGAAVAATRVGALSPGALAAGVDIAGHGLPPQPSSVALPPGAASAAAAAGAAGAAGNGGARSALEAQQLREMAAVELELRQLRQMQAVQQRAFERDQVQRQQLRAAAVGVGGHAPPPHHPHAAAQAHAQARAHHLAAGLGGGVGVGVGGALTGGALGGAGLMRGRTGARAVAGGLAGLGGGGGGGMPGRTAATAAEAAAAAGAGRGLLERPSSTGPLGAAAAGLLGRHVGGSPPLRGVAGGGTIGTPGAATAALAGAKLKRPHSAGPLGFMADLMDETDDGVGTSRADAEVAAAAAPGATTTTAGAGTGVGGASGAPGISRSHSAGALGTFTDLLNDADSSDDDDGGGGPTSAGEEIVSPRIAAAQARVEALEKQLELVRQQQERANRAKTIGGTAPGAGGGAGSPPSATSADPAVSPHIAAAQARADALEKKLAQQKELQHGIQEELLQMPNARIAAAQARADALEKQLADDAAARAEATGAARSQAIPAATTAAAPVSATVAPATAAAQAAASVATAPAAALAALPFQRLGSNPRRPARNSGFPLPLMSTKDDKYVPPKIKSLDGFRAAFEKMRANMKSKSNKRKASEMSNSENSEGNGENEKSTLIDEKIPLPEATFNGDIFSNMIYRGKIDLTEQDWTVTGMYSINEKSKAAEKIRQYQAEQILLQEVEAAKAEAAAVRAASEAAAAAAPAAPKTQPTKRKKGWTAEQEQMIAELKRQKAELDEKLAKHQAAKSKEKAAASGGGSLLPPILPNAAIDSGTGIPKAPADPPTGDGPAQDANTESEKAAKEPEQVAARELPAKAVQTSDIRPLVSNEALGAASTLLDLIPRAAKNEALVSDEKAQTQKEPDKAENIMLSEPENGTKRSADEMEAKSTMDQGPLSPNSEDKMMADLQTMGKRKKARILTPPGGETSSVPNTPPDVGEKLADKEKTAAAAPGTGGSVPGGVVVTEGGVSNGSN